MDEDYKNEKIELTSNGYLFVITNTLVSLNKNIILLIITNIGILLFLAAALIKIT